MGVAAVTTHGWRPRAARLVEHDDFRLGARVTALVGTFLLLVGVLFPVPLPILSLGLVYGAQTALTAMGLVLVYRASRVVNFAQGEIGAVAGVLAALLLSQRMNWPYPLAVGAGFLAALASGALIELVFVRRFAKAPRLILTVATIGVAQLLVGLQLLLPDAFGVTVVPQSFPTPFDFQFTWGVVVFRGSHVLAFGTAVLAALGLALFLRFTSVGIAVRACAESADRARLLGISVKRVGTLVWVTAAGLSGLASLLQAHIGGIPIGRVLGPAILLRALAAAVIGRMESLPVTFCAALVLGMVDWAAQWATKRTLIADALMFAVILGALLVQRPRRDSRAHESNTSSWDMVREVRPIPPELRRRPEVRRAIAGFATLLLTLVVLAPLAMSGSRVNLLGTGVVVAIVGISLVILTGWAGEVSLGQMAFFGVGACACAKLSLAGWGLPQMLLGGALAGAAVATVIGIPSLRVRGPQLAVATLGFALAASSYLLNPEFFPGFVARERLDRPHFGPIDFESDHAFYYLLLVILGLTVLSATSLRRSRIGRVLVAARDNPRAAQSFGIDIVRARLVGFAFSGFFAGLAGAAFALHQHAVTRNTFSAEESIRIFTVVVFGGLASVPGVIVAAAYFTLLDYFVPGAAVRFIVSGAGLLVVLTVLREGLGGLLYSGRDELLRRFAKRRGIHVPSLVADAAQPPPPDPVPVPPVHPDPTAVIPLVGDR